MNTLPIWISMLKLITVVSEQETLGHIPFTKTTACFSTRP